MNTTVCARVLTAHGAHAASRGRSLHAQLRPATSMPAVAPLAPLPKLRVRARAAYARVGGDENTGVWEAATTTLPSSSQSPVQQGRNGFRTSQFFTELVNTDRLTEMRGEELLQKVYGPPGAPSLGLMTAVLTWDAQWDRHRLPGRHIKYLLSLTRCKYTFNVVAPMVTSFVLTLFVGIYSMWLVPAFALPPVCKISLGALGVFTSCLSLLLVFRTNNSYGRFDEARKLWGSFINRSRDIVRQCVHYFPSDKAGQESLRAVARWTAALAFCMRCHLRLPLSEPIENLRGWLDDEELALLEAHEHRPNCCMQVLGELIHMNVPSRLEALKVDENIKVFEDFVGACERIYRTPIPNSYTRHTSRFLCIWALLVPAAMWAEFGWMALFFAPLLTFLLFAIDEIGVQLEEPFSVLPLAHMCEKIRSNTQEILERAGDIRGTIREGIYRRIGAAAPAEGADGHRGANGGSGKGAAAVPLGTLEDVHGLLGVSGSGNGNGLLLNNTLPA